MAARRSSAKTARSPKSARSDTKKKKSASAAAPSKGKKKASKKKSAGAKRTATAKGATAARGRKSATKKVAKTSSRKASAKKAARSTGMSRKKAAKKTTKKAGKKAAAQVASKAGKVAAPKAGKKAGKKAARKAAASKDIPASKGKTRGKKSTRASSKTAAFDGASSESGLGPAAVEALDAGALIQRLQLLAHVEDDAAEEVPLLIDRLDRVAEAHDLPALFGALTGDDALGVQWSLFFIMERFDDEYLEALFEALPGLHQRAPEWAQTAVIRILNTRGDDDDCTDAFEQLALSAAAEQREALVAVLHELATDPSADLLPRQHEGIVQLLEALGETLPDPDALHPLRGADQE